MARRTISETGLRRRERREAPSRIDVSRGFVGAGDRGDCGRADVAGIEKPLAHHRLNSAVDEVRTEWCQARTEAMRSGRTYAFRYQVGGDHYYTELESGLNGNASEGDSPLVSSAAAGAPSAASSNAAGPMDNRRCQRVSSSPPSSRARARRRRRPPRRRKISRRAAGLIRSSFIRMEPPRTFSWC